MVRQTRDTSPTDATLVFRPAVVVRLYSVVGLGFGILLGVGTVGPAVAADWPTFSVWTASLVGCCWFFWRVQRIALFASEESLTVRNLLRTTRLPRSDIVSFEIDRARFAAGWIWPQQTAFVVTKLHGSRPINALDDRFTGRVRWWPQSRGRLAEKVARLNEWLRAGSPLDAGS